MADLRQDVYAEQSIDSVGLKIEASFGVQR
jgi:hypothetical protein